MKKCRNGVTGMPERVVISIYGGFSARKNERLQRHCSSAF